MGNSSGIVDRHWQTKFFVRNDLKNIKVKEVDWDNASDPTPKYDYNCVGFAIGVLKWWEPKYIKAGKVLNPYAYWPSGLPHNYAIETYIAAAGTEGFKESPKNEWDAATTRKIILYHRDGEFTH